MCVPKDSLSRDGGLPAIHPCRATGSLDGRRNLENISNSFRDFWIKNKTAPKMGLKGKKSKLFGPADAK